jgi:oxygen-independent coproporphyrinogen-3 oxidase
MYSVCHEVLTAAGYDHYEISSYAVPGRRSVHNSLYWTMGAYLGVGMSASSFRPLAGGDGWRFTNPRSLQAYLGAAKDQGVVQPELLEHRSADQIEEEALWLALRMSDGIDRALHRLRWKHDPLAQPWRSAAAIRCVEAGWLEITPDRIRLRPEGFLFADEVAVRIALKE